MSNPLIYIVQTTTGDKWELCGGSYLVRSKNLEQAGKDVIEFLKDQGITNQSIVSTKRYYKSDRKYDVELLQEPIVE